MTFGAVVQPSAYFRQCLVVAVLELVICCFVTPLQAAITWDGGGASNWWFDPSNWSREGPAPFCPCLPPAQERDGALIATDAQINGGSSVAWDKTGEGVVFDPENDPFLGAAFDLNYPTGSPAANFVGHDYGPTHLHRLYMSRNTTNSNLLTIKSGELVIASTTIIGRSGSTEQMQNLGRVNQLGGTVSIPVTSMEIGQSEDSGWGNGIWDYRGGTLEVSLSSGPGLRLAHGRSASGAGGEARFIMHNPDSGGHVRVREYHNVSYRGVADGGFTELDPNGVTRGVATTEFHLENGYVRPIQVVGDVTLNNGFEPSTQGFMSTRLELVLDEAPSLLGNRSPLDLGLFDVDFDIGFGTNGGTVTGFGDVDGDDLPDAVFANHDGSEFYEEGDIVSAGYGATKYNWTISYTGNIEWDDPDESELAGVEGPESGTDIVLIGESSEPFGLVGDYNDNGIVDAADYTVWRDNLGSMHELSNDVLGGTIGLAHYNQWVANFGNTVEQFAIVPEPGQTSLMLLGALVVALVKRRKWRSFGGKASMLVVGMWATTCLIARPALVRADPALFVSDMGLNDSANREWLVEVMPDADLFTSTEEGFGGSLQLELAFEINGGNLLSAAKHSTYWTFDSIGNNPFSGTHSFGVQSSADQVFASLGSTFLADDARIPVLTIETAGDTVTTIDWGGHTLLTGSPFEYVGSRISQAGVNFDGYQGSISTEPPGSEGDFNSDGLFNCLDIDALMGSVVSGDNDITFDLTNDALVDLDDRDSWLEIAATANGFAASYSLGDVTLDGTVDAADLNELGIHWLGEHAAWCQGNSDADIRVNANDLNAIGISWQQSIPRAASLSAPVPEPTGATMMILCGFVLLAFSSSSEKRRWVGQKV